jgi:DNA-binding MarR family transcriptional regulator
LKIENEKSKMKKLKETKNFGAFLDRTLRRIRLDMGRRLTERGVDITPEQWIILSSLYERDGQSQTELGDDSFKNPPTVSRIIDLLCKKELTERRSDSGDRRRHKIYLTAKGREIVEQALPAIIATREKGWNGLSDEDYVTFLRIINQIFHNFDDVK